MQDRRKRVLLLTNSVMMGGLERHVELLARHLSRERFEIFTACPDWPAIAVLDQTLRRVADHHVRCTPDRRWGLRRAVVETWKLYRHMRAYRIDVLHMHLTAYRGGWWALLAAHLAGVQMIVCTEHLAPEAAISLPRRLMRRLFVLLLNQLISVSEKNRSARAQYLYTPASRTSVVVNGVDPNDFMPIAEHTLANLRSGLQLPQAAQIVGSVVRLSQDKGLDDLLDALPLVLRVRPDTCLLLVGDGPIKGELAAQAARLGVQDRVIFAGYQADPRPYMALMDVFVLPVPVGSMSIALLEAMAMRRPVIITFGDPGEAVIHQESGLWTPPRDPQALAQAILALLSDPPRAQRYGEAARRRVEEQYSAAAVAQRMAAIYCGHGNRRGRWSALRRSIARNPKRLKRHGSPSVGRSNDT